MVRAAVAVAILYGIATAFFFRTQPAAENGDPNPKVDAAAFFAAGALWREGEAAAAYASRSETVVIEIERAAGLPRAAPRELTLVRVLPDEPLSRAALEAGYADATPPVFLYLPGYLPLAGLWSALPWRAATWLLDAASMALLALAAAWAVAVATAGWKLQWQRWTALGAVLVLLPLWHPVRFGLFTGQVSILATVAVLLTAIPRLRHRGTELALGAGVALLGGLKLFPLVAVGFFALRREHLRNGGALAGLVLLILGGFLAGGRAAYGAFFEALREMGRGARVWTGNQSTEALLHRFVYPVDFTRDWIALEPTPLRWLATLVALGVLAALVALFHRRPARTVEDRLRDAALLLAALLLVPPVAWTHYYVFLLPGLLLLGFSGDLSRCACTGRAVALFALLVTFPDPAIFVAAYEPLSGVVGEGAASVVYRVLAGLPWFGAAGVATMLAVDRWKAPPVEIPNSR